MRSASAKELNEEVARRYGNVEDFLDLIQRAMKKTGTSQAELARRSGYNPSHICRWLSGKESTRVTPSLETRMVLAETMEEILVERMKDRQASGTNE